MSKLKFVRHPHPSPTPAAKRAELLANPGFGRVFSDHMVTIRYSEEKGWHDARIDSNGPRRSRAALRAGDLRGAEGLQDGRRRDVVPAAGKCPPLPAIGGAARHAGPAREPVP